MKFGSERVKFLPFFKRYGQMASDLSMFLFDFVINRCTDPCDALGRTSHCSYAFISICDSFIFPELSKHHHP